ncbi:response regulator [Streptomyces lonarensis]|uniref:Response regulator n=1 Tax=Streptomyces lonarensis TaxID=700599 RepID=A0A7X6CYP6_9ACTN|nr:response regulator [Streptomyces lonarensis]NJQ04992.1 response regulator [Streptomyces lonarensis]
MPGACGRVLVVDDSQVIRQLMRVVLELDGFEVMTATDGVACLENVRGLRPDLITLDVAMPRLDGLSTAERLREDPDTGDIPLMLVSATPVGPRPPPVDAVVPKPFDPHELLRHARRLARGAARPSPVRWARSLAG